MRDWTLPLLRCLSCRGRDLRRSPAGVRCRDCDTVYPTRDGVTDFLHDLHQVPARERAAVHGFDSGPEDGPSAEARLAGGDELPAPRSPDLVVDYESDVQEVRRLMLELLRRRPIPIEGIVLELGADRCWGSSILLDRGLRVIALDITDHLHLAPDPGHPHLTRIQADMNRVPLGDKTVDLVWAVACIHHSWDLNRTFGEIFRVLRPGGTAHLCAEPMPGRLRHLAGRRFGDAEREAGINETWLPRPRWLEAARSAGLEPELVFPELSRARIAAKLEARGLPTLLAPLLRPVLPALQVSLNMVARKRAE